MVEGGFPCISAKRYIIISKNEHLLLELKAFISRNPGLIVKMSKFITRQSYQYECLFVDHNYDFTYVHILKSQTGYEALGVKGDFEDYAEFHGVKI